MRLIALFALVGSMTTYASGGGTVSPHDAILASVREHVGSSAVVLVDEITTKVTSEAGLVAEPDAAARLGQLARFMLSVNGKRRGMAIAKVTVRMPYPRAARSIARDEMLDVGAIAAVDSELTGLPMHALLTPDEVKGLKARRDIAKGEALTESALRVPPIVKSGDAVDATVRIGTVSVTTSGTASGSGQIGDVIRVMQPHSSRLLNARIVGPGVVEILP
jgi:flagella basal body P-ring formation protein FlgA